MHFTTAFISALSVVGLVSAGQISTTISYDETYDNAALPLTSVACSDGANGLITKYGYKTLGQLPKFPMVGGTVNIAGWNSAQCGTCYGLTYGGRVIYIAAVDHTNAGFNVGLQAFNVLTNGQGKQLGRVTGTYTRVKSSRCGF